MTGSGSTGGASPRPDPHASGNRSGWPRRIAAARALVHGEVGRIVRFGLVGIVATLVHMSVALGLANLFAVPLQAANLSAFLVAFTVSFAGHHRLTFRSRHSVRRTMPRFAATATTGYAASAAVLSLGTTLPLSQDLRLVIAACVIPFVSYLANRFLVF